jgi:hypothetical protein
MESIKLWARNGEAVRQAIELGEIAHIETASEELTDEFLLFAIQSGLLAGIRLRRDSLVSVMYSTDLNSATSSVTPQRTDRHGILGEKPSDFQLFSRPRQGKHSTNRC